MGGPKKEVGCNEKMGTWNLKERCLYFLKIASDSF